MSVDPSASDANVPATNNREGVHFDMFGVEFTAWSYPVGKKLDSAQLLQELYRVRIETNLTSSQ